MYSIDTENASPELIFLIFLDIPRYHPLHSSCATSRCPPARARRETRGPPWRLHQTDRSSGPWDVTTGLGARGWFWAEIHGFPMNLETALGRNGREWCLHVPSTIVTIA